MPKLFRSLLLFALLVGAMSSVGGMIPVALAGSFWSSNNDGITFLRYRVNPPEGESFTLNFFLEDTQIQKQRLMLGTLPQRNAYFQQLADEYLRTNIGTDGRTIFRNARREMTAIKQQANQELPGFVIRVNATENKYTWKLGYSIPAQSLNPKQHAKVQQYSSSIKQAFQRYNQRTTAYERQVASIRANRQYKADLYRLFDIRFFTDTNLQTKLTQVDYSRIAQASSESLTDLARAIRRFNDPNQRARVKRVLAFMQSIPYDTLGSRSDSRTFLNGFFPPAVMLTENRGDCDIKATAMASLLKQVTPRLKIAIVIIPGHALLGVTLAPEPNEKTLNYKGRKYVLMEPVGPAFTPIGEINDKSLRSIQKDQIKEMYIL